jgi:dethiobiotin synthetase
LEAVIAIGLRSGCISHGLLTVARLVEHEVPIAGAVLVERWGPTGKDFRADVTRALVEKVRILGMLPHEVDERASIEEGARLFEPLFSQENAERRK